MDEVVGESYRFFSADFTVQGLESLYNLVVNRVYPELNPFGKNNSLNASFFDGTYEVSDDMEILFMANSASLRADLYKGNITLNDVYGIEPFNNYVCIFHNVTGTDYINLLQTSVEMDTSLSTSNSAFTSLSNSPEYLTREQQLQEEEDLYLSWHGGNSAIRKVSSLPVSERYRITDFEDKDDTSEVAKKNFDLITTTYDCVRLNQSLDLVAPSTYTYITSNITTRQVLLEYIKVYMRSASAVQSSSPSVGIIVAIVILSVVIVVFFPLLFWLHRKNSGSSGR